MAIRASNPNTFSFRLAELQSKYAAAVLEHMNGDHNAQKHQIAEMAAAIAALRAVVDQTDAQGNLLDASGEKALGNLRRIAASKITISDKASGVKLSPQMAQDLLAIIEPIASVPNAPRLTTDVAFDPKGVPSFEKMRDARSLELASAMLPELLKYQPQASVAAQQLQQALAEIKAETVPEQAKAVRQLLLDERKLADMGFGRAGAAALAQSVATYVGDHNAGFDFNTVTAAFGKDTKPKLVDDLVFVPAPTAVITPRAGSAAAGASLPMVERIDVPNLAEKADVETAAQSVDPLAKALDKLIDSRIIGKLFKALEPHGLMQNDLNSGQDAPQMAKDLFFGTLKIAIQVGHYKKAGMPAYELYDAFFHSIAQEQMGIAPEAGKFIAKLAGKEINSNQPLDQHFYDNAIGKYLDKQLKAEISLGERASGMANQAWAAMTNALDRVMRRGGKTPASASASVAAAEGNDSTQTMRHAAQRGGASPKLIAFLATGVLAAATVATAWFWPAKAPKQGAAVPQPVAAAPASIPASAPSTRAAVPETAASAAAAAAFAASGLQAVPAATVTPVADRSAPAAVEVITEAAEPAPAKAAPAEVADGGLVAKLAQEILLREDLFGETYKKSFPKGADGKLTPAYKEALERFADREGIALTAPINIAEPPKPIVNALRDIVMGDKLSAYQQAEEARIQALLNEGSTTVMPSNTQPPIASEVANPLALDEGEVVLESRPAATLADMPVAAPVVVPPTAEPAATPAAAPAAAPASSECGAKRGCAADSFAAAASVPTYYKLGKVTVTRMKAPAFNLA